MIKNLRKFLYLLQLEEYQTDRYFTWLKKNKIEQLEERKGWLKYNTAYQKIEKFDGIKLTIYLKYIQLSQ